MNKICQAFDSFKADSDLKEKTKEMIRAKREQKRGYRSYIVAFAACFVFLGFGIYLFFDPTLSLAIEVNPAIELGINRFDIVISATAKNDDGQKLLADIDILFKNCDEAVRIIVDDDYVQSLISADEILSIGVVGDGEQSQRVLADIENETKGHEHIDCFHASDNDAKCADDLGLSHSRYRWYELLKQIDPTIDAETIASMKISEIVDLYTELGGDLNKIDAESHHSKTHHGHE